MDMMTLARAKKIAQALVDTLGEDVTGLSGDVKELADDLGDLGADIVVVDADGDLAAKLLMNRLRQHIWQSKDDAPVCESGTVTLTNGRKFPFNNSQVTVSLVNRQPNTDYAVVAAATTIAGNIGEITISDKQVNGFKIAFTGGAASAAVKYIVIGGIIK